MYVYYLYQVQLEEETTACTYKTVLMCEERLALACLLSIVSMQSEKLYCASYSWHTRSNIDSSSKWYHKITKRGMQGFRQHDMATLPYSPVDI